jgi:hypothetical protein
MRALLLGLTLMAALSSQASAQAFGLSSGQSLDRIPNPEATADDPNYFVVAPPEPDAGFERYKAYVYPETGLCEVDGFAPARPGAEGAKAAVALQAKMAAELDGKYGKGVEDTYGDGSATSTVEEDLLAEAVSVQRSYTAESNTLPDGVSSVTLFLQSEGGMPQVSVAYAFDNEDACLTARNAAIDKAGT